MGLRWCGDREIAACRPWFEAELEVLRPAVVVPMGATAAQALLGRSFRVSRQRGEVVEWPEDPPWRDGDGAVTRVVATVRPSAILRAGDDDEARRRGMEDFVADLRIVRGLLPQ